MLYMGLNPEIGKQPAANSTSEYSGNQVNKKNILHGKLVVHVTKSNTGIITKCLRSPENPSYTLHKLNILTKQKEAALAGMTQCTECWPAN